MTGPPIGWRKPASLRVTPIRMTAARRACTLTDAGHAALKHARVLLRELNGKLCDGFSDDELDVVARWLHALQERFPAER